MPPDNRPIYNKPPLSVAEQLQFLEDKGLIIDDLEQAQTLLWRVGFYRFKGYALSLRDLHDPAKPFRPESRFSEVQRLIKLDDELRLTILAGIQVLEPAVRTAINEVLCEMNGIRWYAEAGVFRRKAVTRSRGKRQEFKHRDFLEMCRNDFYRNEYEPFVEHYKRKYDLDADPPAWMLIETLSMGKWSRVFSHLDSTEARQEIAERFEVRWQGLASWLHALSTLRNACAHHSRIWNRQFGVKPSLEGEAAEYNGDSPVIGNDRLGAQLLVLVMVLRPVAPDFSPQWLQQLKQRLDGCTSEELRQMGLKQGWHEHHLFTGSEKKNGDEERSREAEAAVAAG